MMASVDQHARRSVNTVKCMLHVFKTSYRWAAATISPAQACKWWHDIRRVRIWIGDHYCMSMLACQYNQPKRPGDFGLWNFDLENGARVTCDVGYLSANFSLPRPLCSRDRPNVRDRQTSDKSIA